MGVASQGAQFMISRIARAVGWTPGQACGSLRRCAGADDARDELLEFAERCEMDHLAGSQMLGPAVKGILGSQLRRELQKVAPHAFQPTPKTAANGARLETRPLASRPARARSRAMAMNGAPVEAEA